jgi:hypothetical protein
LQERRGSARWIAGKAAMLLQTNTVGKIVFRDPFFFPDVAVMTNTKTIENAWALQCSFKSMR